jgi:glycosyltransferase involved in cell wall biosynthesis
MLLRHGVGRALEIMRYGRVRSEPHEAFTVVSAERNMGKAAIRCLQSVYDQDYPRDLVRHVVIDDASTNDTVARVESWMSSHPDHSVTLITNTARLGMLANNVTGFRLGERGQIGVELNGDDWLPDPGVLKFLNNVYSDPDVWMTYNTLKLTDGRIPFPLPPRKRVEARRSYRQAPWLTSALHTFKIALLRNVKHESLLDPSTGRYWEYSQDQAVYLPMLEMAGPHSRHLYRITYVYNFHPQSDENKNLPAQVEAASRIRSMPSYAELETLEE